jgi:hypothetical protein
MALRKDDILSLQLHEWEVEDIMLSAISQAQKDKCNMFAARCGS